MITAFDMPVVEYYRLRDEEGLRHKQIAEHLFISTATLARWKRRNNVTDLRVAEDYYSLRNDGYRDMHIQAKWGITPSALYTWKIRHNIAKEYFATSPGARNR